jgi:hypothetical protein
VNRLVWWKAIDPRVKIEVKLESAGGLNFVDHIPDRLAETELFEMIGSQVKRHVAGALDRFVCPERDVLEMSVLVLGIARPEAELGHVGDENQFLAEAVMEFAATRLRSAS